MPLSPIHLPLEDNRNDVLAKALSHAGLTKRDLPSRQNDWEHFLKYNLHLSPEAFAAMPSSIPSIPLPHGLERHIQPFGEWTLNIWTLEAPEGLIAVDTGLSPDQLKDATHGIPPTAILITHRHRDHVGGVSAYPDVRVWEPSAIRSKGIRHSIGGLAWTVLDLAGHTPDGIGWFTEYQGIPLFFPGDSIFACSIGKCDGAMKLAMNNILHAMSVLPEETIICPGHGPATTVGLEWKRNPFIALYGPRGR